MRAPERIENDKAPSRQIYLWGRVPRRAAARPARPQAPSGRKKPVICLQHKELSDTKKGLFDIYDYLPPKYKFGVECTNKLAGWKQWHAVTLQSDNTATILFRSV
jgi:hypothetical protein